MPESDLHAACVDAWIARMAPASAVERIRLLERGVNALWKRATPTLGPITLGAILNRVLHTAGAEPALVSALQVRDTGLGVATAVDEVAAMTNGAILDQGVRAILTEFLSVLSNVTADILAAPLHAELERMESSREDRTA
jgi:hypothetical protein